MAISTTNLVPLDFETIKSGLKTYLSNQTTFKDIDFNSPNIDVLLDVLAYNTYHNSFYLNMVASEMFLDSAQLRNSVVSHAKMLNYLPRSYRSAQATVDIVVGPSNPSLIESILIPKGTTFTSRVGSNTYTFSVSENVVVFNDQNVFETKSVDLFEGRYITESFTYKEGARYVISNENIDTDSINVICINDGVTPTAYTRATSFIDINSLSNVYFVQATENSQYEIIFGDDVFGKKPVAGSTVVVEYRVSSGELANGASYFEIDGPVGGTANVSIQTVAPAAGGAIPESNEEIRFRAPQSFLAQERAVSVSDYSTLIRREFPEVNKINVFGGEELDPPKYGYVVISMVSDAYDAISETRQNDVLSFITKRAPLTVTPIIQSPEFTYIQLNVEVGYDNNKTTKTSQDIKLLVLSAIRSFAESTINDFNSTLHYSKMLSAIDDSDASIISNSTDAIMYKLLNPIVNKSFSAVVDFGNELQDTTTASLTHALTDISTMYSSYFTFEGKRCLLEDNGDGSINILTAVGDEHITVKSNVGFVDYKTGIVNITDLIVSSYEGNGIRLFARTKNKDIAAIKNSVLVIRDNDVSINVAIKRTQ